MAAKPASHRRKPRTTIPRDLLDPWERQPGESNEAWQAFVAYRDMQLDGRYLRSYRRVARDLGKSLSAISDHAARWQWQARVQAWDVEQDRAKTAAMLAEREELGRRHAQLASGHLAALSLPMREVLRRAQDVPGFLEQLPAAALIRLEAQAARAVHQLTQAERLARGMNTEGPPADGDAEDMRRKSDAELADYLLGVDDGRAIEQATRAAD